MQDFLFVPTLCITTIRFPDSSISPIGSVSTLVGRSVVKGRFGCSMGLHLHGIKRSSLGLVGNHIDVFSGVWTHTDSTIGTPGGEGSQLFCAHRCQCRYCGWWVQSCSSEVFCLSLTCPVLFLDSYYEYLFKAGILFGDKLSLARFSEVQNSYGKPLRCLTFRRHTLQL